MSKWPMQFLIYGAGDAADRYIGLHMDIWNQLNALRRVATNRYVNCVAQLDNSGSDPSVRWLLDPYARVEPEFLPEINTGDPNELINFIRWASSEYPAERCALILSGHGVAWQDEKVRRSLRTARGAQPASRAGQPSGAGFENAELSKVLAGVGDLMVENVKVSDWLQAPSRAGDNGGGHKPLQNFNHMPAAGENGGNGGGGGGSEHGEGTEIVSLMEGIVKGGLAEDSVSVRHPRKLFRASNTRGILIDGTTRDGVEDFLDNSELSRACEMAATHRGGKFAAVVFDACLMSSFEVITEMRGSADTVVAAVDEISSQGLNLRGAAELATARQGALSAQDIARAFPQAFAPFSPTDSCIAVDLQDRNFEGALRSFKTFSRGLLAWARGEATRRDSLSRFIQTASSSVERSRATSVADLGYFQRNLAAVSGLPVQVQDDFTASLAQLQSCILARKTGHVYEQAFGISIFAPKSGQDYIANRPDYIRLRFSVETEWSSVLDYLFT